MKPIKAGNIHASNSFKALEKNCRNKDNPHKFVTFAFHNLLTMTIKRPGYDQLIDTI